ncbi:MAG: hypothetical protein IPH75_13400 [bacterium]|nr:hypothetical protein [bacterium]
MVSHFGQAVHQIILQQIIDVGEITPKLLTSLENANREDLSDSSIYCSIFPDLDMRVRSITNWSRSFIQTTIEIVIEIIQLGEILAIVLESDSERYSR